MGSSLNEGQLLLAIQALRKDPKLTPTTIARIYNVARTTLRERLGGKPARRDISTNSRKLTNSEESVIT